MFVIGVVAGRKRWFETFDWGLARRWFWVGSATLVVAFMVFGLQQDLPPFLDLGLIWGFLEAFVYVGFILGFLSIAHTHFSKPSAWWVRLDANVYGVYIVHLFVVIGLQLTILDLDYPALAKFAIVTVAGLIVSFGTVAALRRIPFIRWII